MWDTTELKESTMPEKLVWRKKVGEKEEMRNSQFLLSLKVAELIV